MENYDLIYKQQFWDGQLDPTVENNMRLRFAFGVKGVDNGNGWNPDDFGSLQLVDGFDVSDVETQQWLLEFSVNLRESDLFVDTCEIEWAEMWDKCELENVLTLPIESFKHYVGTSCNSLSNETYYSCFDREECVDEYFKYVGL